MSGQYELLTKQFPLLGFLFEFNKRRETGRYGCKKWDHMNKPHRSEKVRNSE